MVNVGLIVLAPLLVTCTVDFVPNIALQKFCKKNYDCSRRYKNSVCKYKCELSHECISFNGFEMGDEQRQYILDMHNFFRNLVASGNETRGGHSAASNMMILNYEQEHEDVLQCWIRRCVYEEDKCRSIDNYKYNGENMFVMQRMTWWNEFYEDGFALINESINAWYEEVMKTDEQVIDNWVDDEDIRNASQLLWSDTLSVGCAFGRMFKGYVENLMTWHFFCNYNPGGNLQGEPMYERGVGASDCPLGLIANVEYPHLCGELQRFKTKRRRIAITIDGKEFYHEARNPSRPTASQVMNLRRGYADAANDIRIDREWIAMMLIFCVISIQI